MDTTAFVRPWRLSNMSLMARDSASEKAEGPLYVSEQGTSELPTPPKFASKFRLVSTPKQKCCSCTDSKFFYFQMLPMYYLPTHDDDGFIFLFFRQSRSFVMLKRNFFLLVQKADKEYFAIFYYNTKYSMLHINKSKEKCSKRNSHALLRAGYH